ncbi:MAG: hypothetical protein HRU32_08590 [Rhodobacteraceae bacterium]|nr:hypothetical protein [Paracoccaceae bacterium]
MGLNAIIATFLWCYVVVLVVAWVRAVAREPKRMHIAHFVQLMGLFVPVMAVLLSLIVLASLTETGVLLLLLPLLLPAGLVAAFQLELSRLIPSSRPTELARFSVAAGLTAGLIALG